MRLHAPALLVAVALALALAASAPAYVVIVHPQQATQQLDRRTLSTIFLKKLTRWPDGTVIQPVDQHVDTDVRRAFTEDVFGRTVNAIRNTWLQTIFDGTGVPPPELDSDAAVVEFVRSHPGAIGYVAPGTKLEGVKGVTVR